MARPITLFTGQWGDMTIEELAKKAKLWGFDGLELGCGGDHFDVEKALENNNYCEQVHDIFSKYGLKVWSISNHCVGQAVCDNIDERHKSVLPAKVWGDGNYEKVKERAAEEMKNTARAAAKFGVKVVNGFSGSSIWPYLYSFPPNPSDLVDKGFKDFADRWNPILDVFDEVGVKFALEVHPTEIAFDIVTAERALKALNNRKTFGFNYDPSHLGYQGVDYIEFIKRFGNKIFHTHMKDVYWSDTPKLSGVFGGHLNFGDSRRYWDFRSVGRGSIKFEEVIRALNLVGYKGPLSIEWEDSGMEREHGAKEALKYIKNIDFEPSKIAFDAAFKKEK